MKLRKITIPLTDAVKASHVKLKAGIGLPTCRILWLSQTTFCHFFTNLRVLFCSIPGNARVKENKNPIPIYNGPFIQLFEIYLSWHAASKS